MMMFGSDEGGESDDDDDDEGPALPPSFPLAERPSLQRVDLRLNNPETAVNPR